MISEYYQHGSTSVNTTIINNSECRCTPVNSNVFHGRITPVFGWTPYLLGHVALT